MATRWDDNVTALQAETGMVNGEVAILAGYSSAGDGGGGQLYFTTPAPSARLVTNATNATPIVVTTAAAHGMATGQRVMVAGVSGNTGANGTWVIGTTTSTTLQLTGSAGTGAYTSGGALGDGGGTIPSASTTQGVWTRIP
ncbi:MAG: hypothetical protein JO311_05500 [Candidatus Eremiobacteraeota bacterium]|nr:hypothetical protein [Candidatus Eremiobacteraeota bacterium]